MKSTRLHLAARSTSLRHLRGAVAVEFALSFVVFLPFLFGAIEVARFAALRNSASEATRLGARVIAMCDPDSTSIDKAVSKMRTLVPQIPVDYSSYVSVTKTKSDGTTVCSSSIDCAYVTVTLHNVPIQTIVPLMAMRLTLPAVSITTPREFMSSLNNGICS